MSNLDTVLNLADELELDIEPTEDGRGVIVYGATSNHIVEEEDLEAYAARLSNRLARVNLLNNRRS